MTTFLLSRASSPAAAGRTAQKSSASGDDYASLQYMLGDEGGVG